MMRIFREGNTRSLKARKNLVAMFVLKGINILIGFILVPLTIHYVNATSYGIWLTLSSIVLWISYFDLGLPSGFRNKYGESIAKGDYVLARKYVSTTYLLLSLMFCILTIILLLANELVAWPDILNVDDLLQSELQSVFAILIIFLSIRMIASVFTTILMANQEPAKASALQTFGQILALIAIYILTKTTDGSLKWLALALFGIPSVVILFSSIYMFRFSNKYSIIAPSFCYIDMSLSKDIIGQGIKFFITSIATIVILQLTNVIISRELGPYAVTQYNVSYKYFGIIYMCTDIIASPFWAGVTDAYTKRDLVWIKSTLKKLEQVMILFIPIIIIIMILCTDFVVAVWVGNDVSIPFSLTIATGIFVYFQSTYCIYSNLVNGTGYIRPQLTVFVFFACISVPVMIYSVRVFGLWGSIISPTITYVVQTIVCYIQIHKIVNNTAKGIWCK